MNGIGIPAGAPSTESRFRWVDTIRALAAFLVVVAHLFYLGEVSNNVQILYFTLTRVAVPLFFMVSGYLLLAKSEPYSDFFRKRALKVFFPFLIWSVIYLIWNRESLDHSLLDLIKSYIIKIIRGPRESHLWFFYELFGLYLFTPILRIYIANASNKDLAYFCGIWFLFTCIGYTVQEFTPVIIGFQYYFLYGYVGYFVFGYAVSRMSLTKNLKYIALGVFLLFFLAELAGMYLRSYFQLRTQYFEDYLSFNIIIMSWALYVVLFELKVTDLVYRLVLPLSRASFGIYLVHVIVIDYLFTTSPFSVLLRFGPAVGRILIMGLLGFTVSFLFVFILQKIPVLKYIVP